MLPPSGNPFKCHEEVLYLQPMIPPKRFDNFHPDWGMLRRSRCVQFFSLKTIPALLINLIQLVCRPSMAVNISVQYNGWRHYTADPMLPPSGIPFKCHEEVLSLQPMIPPKRFDIFPPD